MDASVTDGPSITSNPSHMEVADRGAISSPLSTSVCSATQGHLDAGLGNGQPDPTENGGWSHPGKETIQEEDHDSSSALLHTIGTSVEGKAEIPSPTEQNALFKGAYEEEENAGGMQAGQRMFIVSKRWVEHWKGYVTKGVCQGLGGSVEDYSENPPGPMSWKDLVDPEHGELIDTAQEGVNLELLPKRIWDLLYGWYGGDAPALDRPVISCGGKVQVELWPMQVYCSTGDDMKVSIRISRGVTVKELRERGISVLSLDDGGWGQPDIKIWCNSEELTDDSLMLGDTKVRPGETVIFKIQADQREEGCSGWNNKYVGCHSNCHSNCRS
ncbi:unnamed protein product [Discosporangium mesarthrocarpum]